MDEAKEFRIRLEALEIEIAHAQAQTAQATRTVEEQGEPQRSERKLLIGPGTGRGVAIQYKSLAWASK